MNEPKGLPTETWLEAVNYAIAEIRQTGAKNMIFVPGNGWSLARSWVRGHYGEHRIAELCSRSAILVIISPTSCISTSIPTSRVAAADRQSVDIGITTLTPFTQWARQNRKRGFLGEFGAGSNATCLDLLDRALRYMAENNDVWAG